MRLTTTGLLAIALSASTTLAQYILSDSFNQNNFFQAFDFMSGPDPTHGFVSYQDSNSANTSALAGYAGNQVYLGVDYQTPNPPGGRQSVRLESKKTWTQGLFLADIAHMPAAACGSWPAFWTFGANWPHQGEVDIIEGVNLQRSNKMTLHTGPGCVMSNPNTAAGTSLKNADCNHGTAFIGCGQSASDEGGFADGFNAQGGGIYAMQWTGEEINVFFFPRGQIPEDIRSGSPNPAGWGKPKANFRATGCDMEKHFKEHKIVFNITFCGDWAGAPDVWGEECAQKAPTCQQFVAKNPSAFENSYWLINNVKVYKQAGTA